MSYSITLDFDLDPDMTIGAFNKLLADYGFTLSYYNPFGPGGGNPEITLTTENLSNIKHFLLNEYCDYDDLQYHLDSVIIK